jgi:ParB-like chromosome segregation protein Spo0J
LASKQLGLKEVPCIIADDLTDKQIKAFRLADNKVSDYSIWDNKKLLEELEELNFEIFTGFDESDIFNDIKLTEDLIELDEKNNTPLIENEEGVVYTIQIKTQNKELAEKIKELINEE